MLSLLLFLRRLERLHPPSVPFACRLHAAVLRLSRAAILPSNSLQLLNA